MSFYPIVRSAIAATAEGLVIVNEILPITGDAAHYNDVVNEPLRACDNQNAEAACSSTELSRCRLSETQ